jgi:hypothetical protein
MRKFFLLMSLVTMATPLVIGCGVQRDNVVVEPNPNLDEAAETRRSEVELETKQ